jgi:hypothetical protein
MSSNPRAKCPKCGLVRAVQPPAGGDGSANVFPRHNDPATNERCDHGRQLVKAGDYVDAMERWRAELVEGRTSGREAVPQGTRQHPTLIDSSGYRDPARVAFEQRAPVPNHVRAAEWSPSHPDQGPALAELGEALTRRMVALGLPVTGDVERDVAGFERHARGNGGATLGAWGTVADQVLVTLRVAQAAQRPATLDARQRDAVEGLLAWVARLRDEAVEREGQAP